MENGICSLREIEKFCRTDIRYMYLLDEMKAPTFATFGNLIRNELTVSIEQIFTDINTYIFAKDHVDLQHTYIDGTKIEQMPTVIRGYGKSPVLKIVRKSLIRYLF